jgi:hypothetical protein
LRDRCLAGDTKSLRAFFYRQTEGLFAAAWSVHAERDRAWQASLALLRGWTERLVRGRVGEDLEADLQSFVAAELRRGHEAAVVDTALLMWRQSAGRPLVEPPAVLYEELQHLATETAALMTEHRSRRGRWRRWGWVGVGVLVLVAIAVASVLWHAHVAGRSRETMLETLQERVQASRLTWALRDQWLALEDSSGEAPWRAEALAQAALLLEEVGTTQPRELYARLDLLQERLEREQTLPNLRTMAWEAPPSTRAALMETTLLLEEVAAL